MQAFFETHFDAAYLSTVILMGAYMVKKSRNKKQYLLFGLMALILGLGDSFHLIPRAVALNSSGLENFTAALGIGKFITSITMTGFYVILYYVWRNRYSIKGKNHLTISVYALSIIRILLCLFPQNGWTSSNPSIAWGIYRNIPFSILGLLIIILFYTSTIGGVDKPFRHMWLTIVLSFAFYIPVVLWGDAYPLIGMLMIPKTCAYVWTIWIGYSDLKRQLGQMKSITPCLTK